MRSPLPRNEATRSATLPQWGCRWPGRWCRARGREAQPTGDDILEVVPGVEDAEQPAGDAPLVRLDAGVVELDRAQTFVAASRGVDILALLFLAAGAEQRRVDMMSRARG